MGVLSRFRGVVALALFTAGSTAWSQTQTTTSRLYLFNPDPTAIAASLAGLEEAIASRGRVAKNVGLVPGELPARPGEPTTKAMKFGPATFNVQDCGDAYATIQQASDTGPNMLGTHGQRFFGCMYLSKLGIRTTIVMERFVSSGNLFGGLVSAIRDTVLGNDSEFGRKTFDSFIGMARQRAPDTLVELIELPGGDVSRPDGPRVANILAAAAPVASKTAAPSGPEPVASMQTRQMSAAVSDAGAAAAPQAALTTGSAPSASIAQALEARKQLTAMGLTYYSLASFHEAISRGDAIAVELFVQAGAVSSKAPGAGGQNAIDLARQAGNAEVQSIVARSAR